MKWSKKMKKVEAGGKISSRREEKKNYVHFIVLLEHDDWCDNIMLNFKYIQGL